MSFAHIQTKQQSPTGASTTVNSSTISETFVSTPVVGRLVIAYVSAFCLGDPNPLTVSDNQGGGNTWNVISAPAIGGTIRSWIAWSILNVASGVFTVTASFAIVANGAAIGISEFSGADPNPFDGSTSAMGASTAPNSGSLTPSQSGDLFISVVTDSSGGTQTYTIPSGWDGKRSEQPSGAIQDLSSASKIKVDSAAENPLWSDAPTTSWTSVTAAFKIATIFPSSWQRNYPQTSFGGPNPVSRFRSPAAFPIVVTGNIFTQLVSGTLTSAGSLINRTQKVLVGTLTSTGSLLKQVQKILAGVLTSSGSLLKQAQKVLAGTLTSSGTLTALKLISVALSGTLTSSGTLVKQTLKVLSGTLTDSGSLVKTTLKVLAGTLGSSGLLVKQTQKVLTASLTSAGSLVKQTRKILSGALTSSGILATQKVVLKALAGTLTFAGTVVKQTSKVLSGSLATSGTLINRTQKLLSGVFTASGTAAKRIPKALSGTLSFFGTLTGSFVLLFPPAVKVIITGKQTLFTIIGTTSKITITGIQKLLSLIGIQLTPTIIGKQGTYLLTNMANKVNIPDLPLGDDFIIALIFTNSDGTAFNLTGGSASFAMKDHAFDAPFRLQKDTGGIGGMTITDAVNGKVNLTLNASDTVGLAPGPYEYSAKAVNGSSKKNTQIVGIMTWIDSAGKVM